MLLLLASLRHATMIAIRRLQVIRILSCCVLLLLFFLVDFVEYLFKHFFVEMVKTKTKLKAIFYLSSFAN